MIQCHKCEGLIRKEKLPRYETDLGGVLVTLLGSVEREICTECGDEIGVIIPDLAGLVAAAAVSLAMSPRKLNGKEVQFIRKALELSQRDLARAIGLQPETISRWENGKEPIGQTSEKLLRMAAALLLGPKKAPAVYCDPEQIIRMSISPVHSCCDMKPMTFLRIPMKIDARAPKQEHWDIDAAA